MCRVLNVSSRGLRAFRSRPASRRQRSDLVTLAHIKDQSRLNLDSYGRPRMTEDLKEIGLNVGHRCVGRLMRQNGILVVRTRTVQLHVQSLSSLREVQDYAADNHAGRSLNRHPLPGKTSSHV
jgi:transposase InsO family protein